MIIAVDFDGVLCEDKYPEIGPPIMKNINRIKKLQDKGDIIILWTCRKEKYLDEAIKWCKSFDLEFNYINENAKVIIEQYKGNSRKIFADYYIDDKNILLEDSKKFLDKVKNESQNIKYDEPKNYDVVNNPSHYTLGRKFEPAFVINDWDVNWYVGTCIKYLSRLGRKDSSDQDLSKALWYIIAEIAINHKDISKEQIFNTINTIYERRDKYEQLKKE